VPQQHLRKDERLRQDAAHGDKGRAARVLAQLQRLLVIDGGQQRVQRSHFRERWRLRRRRRACTPRRARLVRATAGQPDTRRFEASVRHILSN
jgi:hypothetical protein